MATRDKSTALRQQFGRSVANLSFGMMQHSLQAAQKVGVDMLHTARSFDYYRKIFYHNQSRGRVLRQLQGKRIVDVGCGYTPYARDSMFRACHDAGLDFYGVDPRIEPEPDREICPSPTIIASGNMNAARVSQLPLLVAQ